MQVTFPLGFSSFYLCIGRIKDFEVHSYLFCFSCVLVSSEKVLLPGCRRTCPVQSLVVILSGAVLSMNICWAGYLQPTEVLLVPSECNISLSKSDNLFRNLIGLRVLIFAISPWKGWPKYKAVHIFLLCLTAVQPVKAQVSRAVSGHQLTRYEVVFLCSWPVSPSLTMLYLLNL